MNLSCAGLLHWDCAGLPPVTMYKDGIYVNDELWRYWQKTFPHHSVDDMFAFVKYDINNERAEFIRSQAWRGHRP